MITRKEWYEMVVESFSKGEFEHIFGCEPLDIMDFDYNFNNVHWNMNLEYAYNEFCLV